MATREHDNDQPRSPWSRTSVQLSALFVLMLLVVGIAIAIFHHGSSAKNATTNHAKGGAQTSPAAAATSGAANPEGCSLPTGSQEAPSTSPPAGVTWNVVGSMNVPQSGSLGPQRTKDGLQVCFAHSPSGALLAAMNYYAEGTSSTVTARQLAEQLSVNVPKALLAQPGNGASGELEAAAGGPVQIAGYKFDSYSPERATYDIVIQGPHGALTSITTTMIWTGQDWRYSWPADNNPSMEVLQERTLVAPYVAWSEF
jgi:hypothetical protein